MTADLTFFHAPNSRSGGARALLEELGADYELHVLDLKAGTQRQPEYLAVNPMGKVPAILHRGALVTEQPAVFLYLADLFPERNLAPPIGDPLRGPSCAGWCTTVPASSRRWSTSRCSARRLRPRPVPTATSTPC